VLARRGGHSDDVFDLAWAPDASALLSGSIENICVLWDVDAGKSRLRLANHSHYVQGVAWDPARQYLVSQSADRSCRRAPAAALEAAAVPWQRPQGHPAAPMKFHSRQSSELPCTLCLPVRYENMIWKLLRLHPRAPAGCTA
jgi:hypothetical protein